MTELWKEPAEIVGIAQEGVPYGLAGHITEHGFVLENGTVLLESKKDGLPEKILESFASGHLFILGAGH